MTPAEYDPEWARTEPREALSTAGGRIQSAIKGIGRRERAGSFAGSDAATVPRDPVSPAPGGSDGWRYFAGLGALPKLLASDVLEGHWVVHSRHGLGEVIGFDPEGSPDRTVTIRFDSGLAVVLVSSSSLFRPEPRQTRLDR